MLKISTPQEEYSTKKTLFYSFAGFTDVILLQFFTYLIFTFYYSVVGLNINYITIAFIIWSIWNALNDPMLGAISDRTRTKLGRRKPYIIASIFPLLIINILLWMPPLGNDLITFFYFLAIIVIWELFYTMYSLNQTALFPEMFHNLEQRAKANTIIQFLTIISLMVAFLLPSFFIPRFDDPLYFNEYTYAAITISIICLVSTLLFIKFGLKEKAEFAKDAEKAPGFFNSLKFTLKNKTFLTYVLGTFSFWYSFGMIPTILPLYGSFVLNTTDSLILSLLLATAFISAAIFIFIWKLIIRKFGAKKSFIIAILSLIFTLSPFMFISGVIFAFISFSALGFGLAGALIVENVTISAVIDHDELQTGVRREGSFFGINGFFAKLTNVFVFLTIAIVFNNVGWEIFDPVGTTEQTILGLRSLMFIFPALFLCIGLIAMKFFPITKDKYDELTQEAKKLHEKKREEVQQ